MAVEPIYNKKHNLSDNSFQWRVNKTSSETALQIFKNNSEQIQMSYDISSCMFCSGEDDNCEKDGVFEFTYGDKSNNDALGLVCHTGAHSQRLLIFDYKNNLSEPVIDVVGLYYVDYKLTKQNIIIKYDVINKNEPSVVLKYWPTGK